MDCSSLNDFLFIQIGSYYLYIKPRAQSSMKLPSHQYPPNLKPVKAGASSPEEQDKRLYESFGLDHYELPFICIVHLVADKNMFTIILHDYQGQLNKQYEDDEMLRDKYLNSIQSSTVPTPMSETPMSETPINETPMSDELNNDIVPSTETPTKDDTLIHEESPLEGTLNDDALWKSVMLSHHLALIQNHLEFLLFEAKNKCRMNKILLTGELDDTVIVDSTRCE